MTTWYKPGETAYVPFDSFKSADGSSITMSGFATTDIKIYKDGGTTERASQTGFTLLDTDGIDFDGITGIHGYSIDLSSDATANFFKCGSSYFIVIDAITVDSLTVRFVSERFRIGMPHALINTHIATLASQTSFTLNSGPAEDDALKGMEFIIWDKLSAVQFSRAVCSAYTGSTKTVTLAAAPTFTITADDNVMVLGLSALVPATPGRTLVVDSAGLADANAVKVGPTGAGTAQTAGDIPARLPAALVSGRIDSSVGAMAAGVVTTASLADGFFTAAKWAAGAIDASAIAANAFAAAKFASGAFDAVWTVAARVLTAGTNIVLAKGTGVTGFNDIAAADVWAAGTRTLTAGTNIVLAKGTGLTGLNDLSAAQVNTEADTALSDIGATITRMAFLDKLNISGLAASAADIAAITQAQKIRIVPPPLMEQPESGSTVFRIYIYAYNETHTAEDLDSNPTVTAENNAAVSRTANCSAVSHPATGVYYFDYTVAAAHAVEGLVFKVTATEGAVATEYAASSTVVDVDMSSTLAAMAAKVDTLHDTRLTAGRAANLDEITAARLAHLDVDVSSRLATAGYTAPPSSATVAAAVWDLTTSGHTTGGTFGAAMNAAGSAGDPWATALPGSYTAGSAGKIIGDNINATVGSRAVAGDAMALTSGERTTLVAVAWNALTSGFATAGSIGKLIKDNLDAVLSTAVSAVQTAVLAKLPAALVGGRMDSSIGAAQAGSLGAAAFAAGAFDAVWTVATRRLSDGTNIVLVKGTGVIGFNDLDAAGVRTALGLGAANLDTQLSTIGTITTRLGTAIELDGSVYRFTTNALEMAPSGGGGGGGGSSDIQSILSESEPAHALSEGLLNRVKGTVDVTSGLSPSTREWEASGSFDTYPNGVFIGRAVEWTSGTLKGSMSRITNYRKINSVWRFTTQPSLRAPSSGDTFRIA